MTLLERRRAMMSRKAEPEWDYVLTATDDVKKVQPISITISAGQTLLFEWEGLNGQSFTWKLWTLNDDAKFVGTTNEEESTRYLDQSGTRKYIVETGGTLVLGGLNVEGTVSAYLISADYVKAQVT